MKYDEFLKRRMDAGNACRHQPQHVESGIQRQIIAWFRLRYPEYIIAAVPNGGYRNAREAKIMKAEGVLAGFSDLVVIAREKVLFVEVKTQKGRQSECQKLFQKKVENLGFSYCVCRSFDGFILSFEGWLKQNYMV